MPAITSPEHRQKAARVRQLLAAYQRSEDLVRVGAYQRGADPLLDQALSALPALTAFARQEAYDRVPLEAAIQQLMELSV